MEDYIAMDDGRAGRRAAAYWFIDGLPEIVFGILYFAWGGIGLVWGFSLQNPWMKWATLAAFPIFLLVYWNDLKILDFCKARMTYPRTGFVSPPAEPPQDRDEIVTLRTAPPIERNVTSFRRRTVSVFFAATAAVDATRDIPIMAGRWGVPIARVVVAAVVYALSRRDVHPYSWWSAFGIALAGLLSAAVEVPPRNRMFLPLLIGGVWLLAHGVPTLVRYLRTYPAPKGEGA